MKKCSVVGRINSLLSMSALDGDGIRTVIFMQGCPLRCLYCHNPDAWDFASGTPFSARELLVQILKYRKYFGEKGGVTLSGGEVLAQADFAAELLALCRQNGLNTAIETSGCLLSEQISELLSLVDHCMLDIKMNDDASYEKYTGGSLRQTLQFLDTLDKMKIRTTVRQVILPEINDTEQDVFRLKALCKPFSCIDRIQLLPFRKLCVTKYRELGLSFPLEALPETPPETIEHLTDIINKE